jgi:HK97 gp10 family phage protein
VPELKNLGRLLKKLDQIQAGTVKAAEQVLTDAARQMRNTAEDKMRQVSPGRFYKEHQASRPGDYPNVDTGALVNSLFFELNKGRLEAKFGTKGIPYARFLEYGTVKMAPRPFIRPSYNKHYKTVGIRLSELIDKVIKRNKL